jgi:DNA invertase Pin-like site-specific DNA recombinase
MSFTGAEDGLDLLTRQAVFNALVNQGISKSQIARGYGISRQRVYQILRHNYNAEHHIHQPATPPIKGNG